MRAAKPEQRKNVVKAGTKRKSDKETLKAAKEQAAPKNADEDVSHIPITGAATNREDMENAFAPRIGARMKHFRTKAGIDKEAVASSIRIHNMDMYEKIENGSSALEHWGPLLANFAITLRVPCKLLNSNVPLPHAYKEQGSGENVDDSEEASTQASRRGSSASTGSSIFDSIAKRSNSPSQNLPLDGERSQSPTSTNKPSNRILSYGQRVKQLRLFRKFSPNEMLEGIPEDMRMTPAEYTLLENGGSGGGYERWCAALFSFAEVTKTPLFNLVADVQILE